ncbi:hypothetical protein L6R52_10335 [Myxococcota bacterium]|nr:hypothetical protein [Myxococcota bacterium]
MYWLAYPCDLDRLGFASGFDRAKRMGSGRQLPEPDRLFKWDREGETWESPDTAPPDLLGLRIAGSGDCVGMDRIDYRFPYGHVPYVASDGVGQAIISPESRTKLEMLRVNASGLESMGIYPPIISATAGVVTPDSDMWLFGAGGKIARGKAGGPFAVTATVAVTARSELAVAAARDGTPEMFVSSNGGLLARFDYFDAEVLLTETSTPGAYDFSRVVWLGPGHAVALLPSSTAPVEYRDGQTRTMPWPAHLGRPYFLAASSGLGLVAGTIDDGIVRRSGESWVEMPLPDSGRRLFGLFAFRRGILAAFESGYLVEYLSSGDVCAPWRLEDGSLLSVGDAGGDVFVQWRVIDFGDSMASIVATEGSCPGRGLIRDYGQSPGE